MILYDIISQVPTLKKTLTVLPPARMLLCFFRCVGKKFENIKELEKGHHCAAACPESEYRVSGHLVKCWVSKGTSSTQNAALKDFGDFQRVMELVLFHWKVSGCMPRVCIRSSRPPLKCLSFPRDIECPKCCSILRWSGGG